MQRIKKKKVITAEGASELLKITKDDFYILCAFFNQNPVLCKQKEVLHLNSKKRTQFSKDRKNKEMLRNMSKGFIDDKRVSSNALDLKSDAYPIEFVTKIYNSKVYKKLMKNLNIKKKKGELKEINRTDYRFSYKDYDFDEQVLVNFKNFDEVVNSLPEILSVLFFFTENFFSIKDNYKKNNLEFFDNILQEVDKDLELTNSLLKIFLTENIENSSIENVYPSRKGFYIQTKFLKKEILFFIPGILKIEKLSPIFFYNFKINLSKLKLILCKFFGFDILESKVEKLENNKIFDFSKDFQKKNEAKNIFEGKDFKICEKIEFNYILELIVVLSGGKLNNESKNVITFEVEELNEEKKFVHPQFLFDCYNKKENLDIKLYLVGNKLPELYFPFKNLDEKEFSNISKSDYEKLSSSKKYYVDEMIENENKTKFFY